MLRSALAGLAALAAVAAAPAHAVTVPTIATFLDLAEFDRFTATQETIDFSGLAGAQPDPLTLGSADFTPGSGSPLTVVPTGGGDALTMGDAETIIITLAPGFDAIGLHLLGTTATTRVTIETFDTPTFGDLSTRTFNAATGVGFVGLRDLSGDFTFIRLTSKSGGLPSLTQVDLATVVLPLPPAGLLLAGGLLLLGVTRRRHR